MEAIRAVLNSMGGPVSTGMSGQLLYSASSSGENCSVGTGLEIIWAALASHGGFGSAVATCAEVLMCGGWDGCGVC